MSSKLNRISRTFECVPHSCGNDNRNCSMLEAISSQRGIEIKGKDGC